MRPGMVPFHGANFSKIGSQDAKAACLGEEVVAVAHQAACGDEELDAGDAMLIGVEMLHLAAALESSSITVPEYSSGTSMWTRSIGSHVSPSISLIDDLGLGDAEFIAFAAHRFDQDGQMQLASSGDGDFILFAFDHLQCAGRCWRAFPSRGGRGFYSS